MVDQIGYASLIGHLQHRHGDAWVTLEERVPEPPDEAGLRWGIRVFACPTCEEEVRLVAAEDGTLPGA